MGVKWVTYEDADPVGDMRRALGWEEPETMSGTDSKLHKEFGEAFLSAVIEWISESDDITVDMVFDEDAVKEFVSETYTPTDIWDASTLIDHLLSHAGSGQLETLNQTLNDRRWK